MAEEVNQGEIVAQEATAEPQQLGPHAPGFGQLALTIFGGLGGGVAGTLVLFLISLGASIALEGLFQGRALALDEASKNPLFIFIVIATIFLCSLVSNIVGGMLFIFARNQKYTRTNTVAYQIFFVNLVIFVLLTPVYIILNAKNAGTLIGVVALLQIAVSTLASMMVLEIVGNTKYAVVGVYNVVVALLFSLIVLTLVFLVTKGNSTIFLFITLPIFWTFLGIMNSVGDMIYRSLYSVYGNDFLSVQATFGGDYGEDEVDEEEQLPPDVGGAQFLSGKK